MVNIRVVLTSLIVLTAFTLPLLAWN